MADIGYEEDYKSITNLPPDNYDAYVYMELDAPYYSYAKATVSISW